MTFSVRQAVPTDGPGVLDLAHRLEEGVAPWRDRPNVATAVRSWVETSMGEDDHACFVAEDGGRIVGFVSVTSTIHWSGPTEAYIGELMVCKQVEGMGVGRALAEEAATWGRTNGYERITLTTGAANERARRFYHSLGFDDEDIKLSRAL